LAWYSEIGSSSGAGSGSLLGIGEGILYASHTDHPTQHYDGKLPEFRLKPGIRLFAGNPTALHSRNPKANP